MHFGEELGNAVVLEGALLVGDWSIDDGGGVEVEDGGVEGEGGAIGFDAGTRFALSEVCGAEIGGGDGRIGRKLEGTAVEADSPAVFLLGEPGGAEVIEGVGKIGLESERLFVACPGLIDGGEMMPGDADFVQGGSVGGSVAVSIDGFEILAVGKQ